MEKFIEDKNQTTNTRIDNLVANNNPTEGNSELIDIRMGNNGRVYSSAGEAVREQTNDCQEISKFFNNYASEYDLATIQRAWGTPELIWQGDIITHCKLGEFWKNALQKIPLTESGWYTAVFPRFVRDMPSKDTEGYVTIEFPQSYPQNKPNATIMFNDLRNYPYSNFVISFQYDITNQYYDGYLQIRILINNSKTAIPVTGDYGAYNVKLFKGKLDPNVFFDTIGISDVNKQIHKDLLNSIGVNLFNKDAAGNKYGYYLDAFGMERIALDSSGNQDMSVFITDYIPIMSNGKRHYYTSLYKKGTVYSCSYDENKEFRHALNQGTVIEDSESLPGSGKGWVGNNSGVSAEIGTYYKRFTQKVQFKDAFMFYRYDPDLIMYKQYQNYTETAPFDKINQKITDEVARIDAELITIKETTTTTTTDLATLTEQFQLSQKPGVIPALSKELDTLASGATMELIRDLNINKNDTEIFSADVTSFNSITLGHGLTEYGGSYITIDNTNIYSYYMSYSPSLQRTIAHGLTISDFIKVIIDTGDDAQAIIRIYTSTGNFKSVKIPWSGCNGAVFIKNNGSVINNCKLSYTCKDFKAPICVCGDSYLGFSTDRLGYQLNQAGCDNWLANGYPGCNTTNALKTFKNIILFSKPKIAVWLLGMNNRDGTGTTPQAAYVKDTTEFINICKQNEIIPILATIPTAYKPGTDGQPIVNVNNKPKSLWVKASTCRYVDMEKAVGSNRNGINAWYDGMLSSDNVHPTVLGAVTLASQILEDVPELIFN